MSETISLSAPESEPSKPAKQYGFVRRRFRKWWQSRLPLNDTLTLGQRNVYILPTRAGLMLGATLVTLLIASINFQLNLGYLLTFLLAGSALAGMHICHGTLRGLTMHLDPPTPQFLGTSATLDIRVVNESKSVRRGIGFSVVDVGQWSWVDVPAVTTANIHVAFQPAKRGMNQVPPITAETRFPLGTFRVWTVWRPAAQLLVYPTPEVFGPPLPPGEPRPGTGGATNSREAGEFDGVRAYRRGDPLKLVVWKKAAKADELVSRDTQQAQRQDLWLDFHQCGATGVEHRLQRLCAWVLQADRLGLDYGLRLPNIQIAPAHGEAHRRNCLEALAVA